MQGIYQIKNLINGHCYVGQSVDIEKRWQDHTYTVNNQKLISYHYPLYRAIRKHGIENFYFTVLEEVENTDDLTRRELYWYDQLKPEYNQMSPEENVSAIRMRPVVAIDSDTLQIVARYESMAQASKVVGTRSANIKRVCDGRSAKARGYYWCYENEFDTWQKPIDHKNGKPICQINKDTGEIIAEYESLSDAQRKTGISFKVISRVINGNGKTAGGYQWQLKE